MTINPTGFKGNKAALPSKPCLVCGRPMSWRREWDKQFPGRIENMFSALQNIVPSHLMDGKRHDFKGIKTTGVANADGDKAFDADELNGSLMTELMGQSVINIQSL